MAGSFLEELGGALVKRDDGVEGRGEKHAWRALLHGCSVEREEEDSGEKVAVFVVFWWRRGRDRLGKMMAWW